MGFIKKLGVVAAVLVTAVSMSARADAATLILEDYWNGTDNTGPLAATWTLEVPDSCTTCTVTLSVDYTDPTAYDGVYLNSFQWVVTNPNTNITSISDASGDGSPNWESDFKEIVNADGCQSIGNAAFTCTDWTGTGDGLLVSNGSSFSWTFDVTFASELTALEGNIRASYDNLGGSNFNIFSPSGGTFTTTTTGIETTTTGIETTTSGIAPEPTMMTLLGAGLLLAGRRLRNRNRA